MLSQKFGKGLDKVHPFSDSNAVKYLLCATKKILTPEWETVGAKYGSRIWSFVSKFVMMDRFIKTLGVAEIHHGVIIPKRFCPDGYAGPGSKVNLFIKIV